MTNEFFRRKGRLVAAGCVLAFAAALILWGGPLLDMLRELAAFLQNEERLHRFMAPMGPYAPLVFIGVQAAQVVLAPIPGEASGFAGGYLFGMLPGLAYSTIGLFIGSLINFYLGRFFGRRYLRLFMSERRIQRFRDLLRKQGVLAGFLLFAIPGFPKDILCLLIGVGSMPAAAFLVICTLGRLPGTLLLSLQGASVHQGDYTAFLAVTAATLVAALIVNANKKRIYMLLEKLK